MHSPLDWLTIDAAVYCGIMKPLFSPGLGDQELRKFPGARNQFIGAPLGDVAQLGEGYGEEIHRQRDRLVRWKFPGRDDHVLVGKTVGLSVVLLISVVSTLST